MIIGLDSALDVRRWALDVGFQSRKRSTLNAQLSTPNRIMHITVSDYLDVVSSWCFWSEPTWAELKRRYEGRVKFGWKIALMDASGFPRTREQAEWYYRRSGTMMGSKVMLKPGWYRPNLQECLAPNLVAVAAREFGVSDDRVRLALARGTLLEGGDTGEWETALEVGAKAGGLERDQLKARALSGEIEQKVRETTAEFHRLQVTQ